jgi:hypothetical protein
MLYGRHPPAKPTLARVHESDDPPPADRCGRLASSDNGAGASPPRGEDRALEYWPRQSCSRPRSGRLPRQRPQSSWQCGDECLGSLGFENTDPALLRRWRTSNGHVDHATVRGEKGRLLDTEQFAVLLEGAAEGRSRLWRIENGLDKAPLILHREPDDFRGLNCLTRGFVGGSDHEIADAAALDFGGAFDNVEHVWRDTRLNPCGAVSRSGHHGISLSVFNVRYSTGQSQVEPA